MDDHPENNIDLERQLADAGLVVEHAPDTSEALSALRKKRFAAVLSDMGRGGAPTAGLELLGRMRDSGIPAPLLIFTSPAQEAEHAEEAVKLGARICTSGAVSLLRSLDDALRAR